MGFKAGDRVRVAADTNYYVPVGGSTGIVVRVSTVAHATANGGGFDVEVKFDRAPRGMNARRADALRALGIGEDYIRRTRDSATIRSTRLERIGR
jgi:hypothetical protein